MATAKKRKVAKKAKKTVTSGTGALRKMTVIHKDPVNYSLRLVNADSDDVIIDLNKAIGKTISISYEGRIECVNCGRKSNKSFAQGYCFPCMRKLAQCDTCIMKPELCHYHEGTCREPKWGEENCMQPHTVYVANTSGLKVGITRGTQVPTRWIDQGAAAAIPLFQVRDRRQSGLVEDAVRKHVADRTDFRRMLKGQPEERDMAEAADELRKAVAGDIKKILKEHGADAVSDPQDTDVREFNYPVTQWPEKVKSVTLDKVPQVSERLVGIKGQYLILEESVFNVRRHGGYVVSVAIKK